jgi:chemotaxis protein histidine kinase CheA
MAEDAAVAAVARLGQRFTLLTPHGQEQLRQPHAPQQGRETAARAAPAATELAEPTPPKRNKRQRKQPQKEAQQDAATAATAPAAAAAATLNDELAAQARVAKEAANAASAEKEAARQAAVKAKREAGRLASAAEKLLLANPAPTASPSEAPAPGPPAAAVDPDAAGPSNAAALTPAVAPAPQRTESLEEAAAALVVAPAPRLAAVVLESGGDSAPSGGKVVDRVREVARVNLHLEVRTRATPQLSSVAADVAELGVVGIGGSEEAVEEVVVRLVVMEPGTDPAAAVADAPQAPVDATLLSLPRLRLPPSSSSSSSGQDLSPSFNPLSYLPASQAADSGGEVQQEQREQPDTPPLVSLDEIMRALAAIPGSPNQLALSRLGQSIGPIPGPEELSNEELHHTEGHGVKRLLAHGEREGKLLIFTLWDGSWEPASGLIGPKLDSYQRRQAALGDTTDYVARAKRELKAREESEEQAEQLAAGGNRRRKAAAPAPAAAAAPQRGGRLTRSSARQQASQLASQAHSSA